MENTISEPKVGAYVLEILTVAMYTAPLDTLREYVQNSFDSINDAERTEILSPNAGRVEIIIDDKNHSLIIRDNGRGVSASEIEKRLLNIGMSNKSLEENAGFRGIGRLAGIAYCERLIFRTQALNELVESRLILNCTELKKAMSSTKREVEELRKVLSRYSHKESLKTKKNGHFFEVIMEGINPEADLFLNWESIYKYLSQTAPVGFDAQSFQYTGEILSWLRSKGMVMPTINLVLKKGSFNIEVFKPYKKITYTTKRERYKINVNGIKFFPENAHPNSPFWIWYAETNLTGMIADETVSGLRLRKNNISIGDDAEIVKIFKEVAQSHSRMNAYFLGEVHINDKAVIPNGRRDGFEDTPEWTKIREELKEFARFRTKEVQNASSARNMDAEKLLIVAEKEISSIEKKKVTGLASKAERDYLVNKISKQEGKLEKALHPNRTEDESKKIKGVMKKLTAAKKFLENTTYFTAKNINPALDKKQKKIITEIISILYDVLPELEFERARDAIMNKYQVQLKERKD